ncbi:MAG: SulP family inorganic anion transporter [Clostridia bacterium]
MFKNLKGDIFGGITVAVVALPLAIAFGIASMNGQPEGAIAGLYGAIFTGIFSTLFGGTPALINGPTGAMVVILTEVYIKTGREGFFLAMIIAGLMQISLGLLKLGKYVKFIPKPVIVGFTNGIGILIFLQQLGDFKNSPIIALVVIAIMMVLPKITKVVPASLVGLIVATPIALKFFPDIDVVGKIPAGFPTLHIPNIALPDFQVVFTGAIMLCILASMESLLSAVIVDDMTDSKSNSNKELIGQGIGNISASLFGGLMGTGAIVRSAVNVNNGGRTKLSGILHGFIILIITLQFGWLAAMIPKAALAGILMITAVKMIEVESLKTLKNVPKSDAVVMIVTMILTVAIDLIVAVGVGFLLSSVLFTYKMSKTGLDHSAVERTGPFDRIAVYTVPGPLFFGSIDDVLKAIENYKSKITIVNMSRVSMIDETAATALIKYRAKIFKEGRHILITNLNKKTFQALMKMHGDVINQNSFLFKNIDETRNYAQILLDQDSSLGIEATITN